VRWFAAGVEPVGVVAIGANATGIIAVGQLATGVVAVGQLARGVVVVGQLAVGVVSIGQLALGVWWAAGMIGVSLRRGFGVIWKAPLWVMLGVAVLWWFVAGLWVWDAATRAGGIFGSPPPPACEDDPMRAC
jgi:hypothetical protein